MAKSSPRKFKMMTEISYENQNHWYFFYPYTNLHESIGEKESGSAET